MRRIFTFIVAFVVIITMTNAQTNLLKNGGFEDDASTYTVENALRRIHSISATKTQIQNPVSEELKVDHGVWYKKAANSGYIKTLVVTDNVQEGAQAIHMKSGANNGVGNLNNWYGFLTQQRIEGELDNTKKYIATFYARVDDVSNNDVDHVNVFISDGKDQMNIVQKIELTGGTTWTEYTSPEFDIPAFKVKNPDADFTKAAYFGIGITNTYNDQGKTNYAGVLIDNIVLKEASPTVILEKKVSAFKHMVSNGNLVLFNLQMGDKIVAYDMTGKTLYNTVATNDNVNFNLTKGLYLVKVNNNVQKIIVK